MKNTPVCREMLKFLLLEQKIQINIPLIKYALGSGKNTMKAITVSMSLHSSNCTRVN